MGGAVGVSEPLMRLSAVTAPRMRPAQTSVWNSKCFVSVPLGTRGHRDLTAGLCRTWKHAAHGVCRRVRLCRRWPALSWELKAPTFVRDKGTRLGNYTCSFSAVWLPPVGECCGGQRAGESRSARRRGHGL